MSDKAHRSTNHRLIITILVLTGMAFLIAAGVFGFQQFQLLKVVVNASATVIDVKGQNSRCGSKYKHDCTKFSALLKFQLPNGQSVEAFLFVDTQAGLNIPITQASIKNGDQVEIKYNPNNPQEIYLDDLFMLFRMPMVFALMGLTEFLVGLPLFILVTRKTPTFNYGK